MYRLNNDFFKRVVMLIIIITAVLICFCDDDFIISEPDTGDISKVSFVWIDDNGGSVAISSVNAYLTVPPESIASPTEVSIGLSSLVSDTVDLIQLGSAVELGPSGTNFDPNNSPILTIPYDKEILANKGISPKNVHIFYYDTDQKAYVDLGGAINEVNNTISTQIHHFSTYIPMAFNILIEEDQRAPIIGSPSFYPRQLVKLPFEARFKIHDYNNAVGLDTDNAMANVECYWEVIPKSPNLVKPGISLSGSILNMERYRDLNDTYYFTIPTDTITHTKDTLKIKLIARDNVGFVSTKTFTLEGGFREIKSINAVVPDEMYLTGGYTRDMRCKINAQYKKKDDTTWTEEILFVDPLDWKVETSDLGEFNGNIYTAKKAGDGKIFPDFLDIYTVNQNKRENYCILHVNAGQIKSIHIIGESGQILDEDTVIGICRPTPYIFDAIGLDDYGNRILIYPYWSASNTVGTITTLGSHAGSLDTSNSVVGSTGTVCISLGGYYTCVNVTVCNGEIIDVTDNETIQSYPDIDYDGHGKFGIAYTEAKSYNPGTCLVNIISLFGLNTGITSSNVFTGDVYFKTIDHNGNLGSEQLIWEGYTSTTVENEYTTINFKTYSIPKVAYGNNKYAIVSTKIESHQVCNSSTNTSTIEISSSLDFTTVSDNAVDTTLSLASVNNSEINNIMSNVAIDFDGVGFGILGGKSDNPTADSQIHHIFFARVSENHEILTNPVDIVTVDYPNTTYLYYDIVYNKDNNEYGIIWFPMYTLDINGVAVAPTTTEIKFMRIDVNGNILAGPIDITNVGESMAVLGSIVWNGDMWGITWQTTDQSSLPATSKLYFSAVDIDNTVTDEILIAESTSESLSMSLMDWGSPYFGISYSGANTSGSTLNFMTINGESLVKSDKVIIDTFNPASIPGGSLIGGPRLSHLLHAISTGGTSFGIAWSKCTSASNYDIMFKQVCP